MSVIVNRNFRSVNSQLIKRARRFNAQNQIEKRFHGCPYPRRGYPPGPCLPRPCALPFRSEIGVHLFVETVEVLEVLKV